MKRSFKIRYCLAHKGKFMLIIWKAFIWKIIFVWCLYDETFTTRTFKRKIRCLIRVIFNTIIHMYSSHTDKDRFLFIRTFITIARPPEND